MNKATQSREYRVEANSCLAKGSAGAVVSASNPASVM